MRRHRYLILTALAAVAFAGSACTQERSDEATRTGDTVLAATRDGAESAADKAKDVAGDIATRTSEIVATTGEAITDAWITTKVNAQFVDETLLENSSINVDTADHVVTLKGTVASMSARDRASTIARQTEGVTRVVNQLVVK